MTSAARRVADEEDATMASVTKITPCLWFDTQGEEAAELYTSIFPNSRITQTSYYSEAGPRPEGMVMMVEFELDGQPFQALNGGPEFTFDEAISFSVSCESQEEVDHYWSRLSDGGEESYCGWLKDRFGVSWQIVPTELTDLMNDPDRERALRATKAMLATEGKLDVAALRAAADAS